MALAMKVMKAMKAKQVNKVMKAKSVVERSGSVGKFAKNVAASKRPAEDVKTAELKSPAKKSKVKPQDDAKTAELENPAKKSKVKPQDEKTLVAERKIALAALKLADLEELHKRNALGTELVKDALARTKEELTSKQLPELKELCSKKELKVGGAKGDLVQRLSEHAQEALRTNLIETLLVHEAKTRKEALAQEAKALEEARVLAAKVRAVVSTMKKEVAAKTGEELKQLLTGYGLKLGGSKDEKVERIVARQREDGEVEKVLASMARDVRKQELLSMNAKALIEMCGRTKQVLDDSLLKEVMVDRLLLCEARVR